MVNVVTIDFDIIMSPSIGLYNNLVDPDDPVADVIEEFGFIANIPADLYKYEYLTRYIIRSLENVTDVYFISNHGSVVDILKKIPHDEPINITNIDHHHDVGYDVENWTLPFRKLSCGNWVKYAKDLKLFDEYTWIKNDNSDPIPTLGRKYINNTIDFADAKLESLARHTDFLIICASYEWVPPVYHPLFLNWQTICEEMKGKEYPLDKV